MKTIKVNHRARPGEQRSLVLLSLLVVTLPSMLWSDESVRPERVDLPTLAALVIAHDPALEALRGAIAAADFKVATAGRSRSPELRARYGESGSWSIPDAHTERSQESESSYTVQLRLFPQNPFLKKAACEREETVKSHAELRLETALQRAALSVARDHREIQFMLAELRLMQRRATGLKEALVDLSELGAARAIRPAEYHKRRAESLIYLSRLGELKRSIVDASTQLKRRAGLDGAHRIAFAGSLYPPHADLGGLDRARLMELALPRHSELGTLQATRSALVSDLSAHRAESIPWLSFISVDYGEDEGVNGQTRDEWSVYAGVSLPVGTWLDGSPRRALQAQLGSIERQGLLTRRNLELKIDALCRSLQAAQDNWRVFEDRARESKTDIAHQLSTLEGNDLSARRTRLALNEARIDMNLQRLQLAHRVSRRLFNLCDAVGCDLPALLSCQPEALQTHR